MRVVVIGDRRVPAGHVEALAEAGGPRFGRGAALTGRNQGGQALRSAGIVAELAATGRFAAADNARGLGRV
ncbi:hypothetical protein [Streptomyces coeruleorubidus]|uniref:hypothetical protein n=1 Tax=Streptomyces coeruleorubidus TaxID=116188 RepID=UPI003687077E